MLTVLLLMKLVAVAAPALHALSRDGPEGFLKVELFPAGSDQFAGTHEGQGQQAHGVEGAGIGADAVGAHGRQQLGQLAPGDAGVVAGGLLDGGVALEGVGRIDRAVADGDGVIEHLTDHAQGALGGFIGTALLDGAQHSQAVLGCDGINGHTADGGKDVLVELLDDVIAVALRPGAGRFGGVPVECNGLKGELGMFAPALIFAAFLGITGIDSVFIEKTFLLIADVAGGFERDPGIGPDAQILASAVLEGREAVPPEPVLATGGVDLNKQASAVREPVELRVLWQIANFLIS